MKKIILFSIIFIFFLHCEIQNTKNFHLVYSVTSLDEQPVDIEITYKSGVKYITEQTQTPFIYEQDIELDESKNENFYFYLKTSSFEKNNINIQIISNDEIKQNFNNIINPMILSGYVGFGLTSVNIDL